MPWLAEWLRDSAAGSSVGLTHCASTVRRVFGLAQEWAAREPDYAHAAWEHVRLHLEAALTAHLRSKALESEGIKMRFMRSKLH
jgi:hypothetical protein